MEIGDYEPQIYTEENQPFCEGIKLGEPYWTICDGHGDNEGYIDVKRHEDAIVISALIRIENLLKNINRVLSNGRKTK